MTVRQVLTVVLVGAIVAVTAWFGGWNGLWYLLGGVISGALLVLAAYEKQWNPSPRVMPDKFHELADYNSGRSKGLVYRRDYVTRMRQLQTEFNAWVREEPTVFDLKEDV